MNLPCIVFDLDETLGFFAQISRIWMTLYSLNNNTLTNQDFFNLCDLFPKIIRPGIFKLLTYLNKIKGKVVDITQINQSQILECCKLLNDKISQMSLGYYFDEKLFKHTFINPVTKCWIILKKNKVTDMISCYFQNSRLSNDIIVKNCNLYFYFKTKNSLKALVSLIVDYSINNDIDRIKVLKIMDYYELENFNFEEGTANINYYIYNWFLKKINIQNISYFVI